MMLALLVVVLALYLALGGGVVWGFRTLGLFPYYKSYWGYTSTPQVVALWALWPIAMIVFSLYLLAGGVLILADGVTWIFRRVAGPSR